MQQLIIIIYSIAIATMFVNAIGLPFRERLAKAEYIGQYENIRPLDCEKCLSFWIALFMCFNSNCNFITTIGTTSITYVLSIFVTKFKNA